MQAGDTQVGMCVWWYSTYHMKILWMDTAVVKLLPFRQHYLSIFFGPATKKLVLSALYSHPAALLPAADLTLANARRTATAASPRPPCEDWSTTAMPGWSWWLCTPPLRCLGLALLIGIRSRKNQIRMSYLIAISTYYCCCCSSYALRL